MFTTMNMNLVFGYCVVAFVLYAAPLLTSAQPPPDGKGAGPPAIRGPPAPPDAGKGPPPPPFVGQGSAAGGKAGPPPPPQPLMSQVEPAMSGGPPPPSFFTVPGRQPPPMGATMVRPPPMPGCLDLDSNTKTVNDTCAEDEECGSYSMECVNKRCACRDNFAATKQTSAPGGGDRFICVALPSFRQQCTDRCQPPLTCASPSNGSDPSFPSFPPFAAGMPMPRAAAGAAGEPFRVCLCSPPAIYSQTTGTCYLECPSGQLYYNGKCYRRCSANEVKVDNVKCMKKAGLGEKCDDARQCTAAYSDCSPQGTCQCKSGFTANKGKCDTKSYSCPVGEPISANGAVVSCEIVKSQNRSSSPSGMRDGPDAKVAMYMPPQMGDTCGEGQFCVVDGAVPSMEGARGHCCPKQKPKCPIGEAHPNATCDAAAWARPDLAGGNAAAAGAPNNRCPHKSHYCLHMPGSTTGVCCPMACSGGFVFVDGQCLPQVQHGDSCSSDAQCRTHNGVCQSGTCACGPKMTTEGTATFKYCTHRCRPDEIIVGNECVPRLKLGDHCDQSSPAGGQYCPMNGFCNKEKVCACRCGFEPIGDRFCGPPPRCGNPDFGGGRPVPMPMPAVPLHMAIREATDSSDNNNSSSNSSDAGGNQTAAITTPAAAGANAPKTSNFSFCKPSPDAESPLASAVEKCADGEYCSYYMPNLGVCCPKPKPTCPPGDTMLDKKCEPRVGCGAGAFCYRYFTPANSSDTSAGFVCCSFSQPTEVAAGGTRPVG